MESRRGLHFDLRQSEKSRLKFGSDLYSLAFGRWSHAATIPLRSSVLLHLWIPTPSSAIIRTTNPPSEVKRNTRTVAIRESEVT